MKQIKTIAIILVSGLFIMGYSENPQTPKKEIKVAVDSNYQKNVNTKVRDIKIPKSNWSKIKDLFM